MPYLKLDTRILDSTLWVDRECREVFITALLMAEPREFAEAQPQIAVRNLESTGFAAPPGWYGFVPAAGVGIVRRAIVDVEAGLSALERLGEPDPESRSKDHGGRRLIRIDGGYLALNFIDHRDRDHTAALRAQRYRDRKSKQALTSQRDVTPDRRDITQAEAEAEALIPLPPTSGEVGPPPPKARRAAPTPSPDFNGTNDEAIHPNALVQIAMDWELPEPWGNDAVALGWTAQEALHHGERFRQYWTVGKGKGKRRSLTGWRQSWSTWLAKEKR